MEYRKKLRPEIDRQTRLQLVLKALLTIGDLPDQMQAAMVVGVCAEMDKSDKFVNTPIKVQKKYFRTFVVKKIENAKVLQKRNELHKQMQLIFA